MTWDDIAIIYNERTGGHARFMPMDVIYDWALTQRDITENEDGELVMVEVDD